MYRKVEENDTIRFNGAVIWDVKKDSSIVSVSDEEPPGIDGERTRRTIKAIYQPNQDANHDKKVQGDLEEDFFLFNQEHGRAGQYGLIRPILGEILSASEAVYGDPTYVLEVWKMA